MVPDAVVVRSGLRVDVLLDRTLARSLARELRLERALGAAVRTLRARPVSERRLRERLRSRGVRVDAEEAALGALADAGFVDDERLARRRAVALAGRGWGDAAIEARLAGDGLPARQVESALADLEPEAKRAARVIAGLPLRKAWALLHRRGFDTETLETVLGPLDEDASDGLG